MRIYTLILVGASFLSAAPYAPSESPDSPAAFLSRGRAMLDADNPAGAIDQLQFILTTEAPLTVDQQHDFMITLARATGENADPRCIALADRFLLLFPQSSEARTAFIVKGNYCFSHSRWSEALEAYRNVDLATLPADIRSECAYRQAICCLRTGYLPEARTLLRSVKSDKDYALRVKYYEAYLDYADGLDERAMEKFSDVARAIAARPSLREKGMEPTFYMTQILFRQKDYKGCIKAAQSLLRRDKNPETLRVLGLSRYALGEYSQARGVLEEYVTLADDNATDDALYALGVCEYDAGDNSLAASRFDRLLDRENALAQGSYLYMGQIEAAAGNSSAAAINFENAWRMNFNSEISETALFDYVAARSKGGSIPFDSNVEMLERFIASYPDSNYASMVERRLASLYYDQGDYEKALTAASRLGTADAADRLLNQKILYAAGTAALSKGNPRRAADLLQRCVSLGGKSDPSLTARANLWLGDARYALKDYAAAERAYLAARKNGGQQALIDYNLGYSLMMQKKFGNAAPYFRTVADTRSADADMRRDASLRLADCLYYSGDYDEARNAYASMMHDAGRESGYASFRHAQLLGLQGDTKGKIRQLEQLVNSGEEGAWMVNALTDLADTYTAEGESAKAAPLYERLVSRYPSTPEAIRAREELERYNEETREAREFDEAVAALESADLREARAAAELLEQYADNVFTDRGAQSAVLLAAHQLRTGNADAAISMMEDFTSSGSDRQYWVARGFIVLADAYTATGKDYLAKEYLRSLQRNYPGHDDDIRTEIARRLK